MILGLSLKSRTYLDGWRYSAFQFRVRSIRVCCVRACELSRYFLLRVYLLLFIGIDCVSSAHSIEWRFERTKNLNGSFDGKAPPPHLILEAQHTHTQSTSETRTHIHINKITHRMSFM